MRVVRLASLLLTWTLAAAPGCAAPTEYVRPSPPRPGLAPRLRSQALAGPCTTYALVFRTGDEVMSGLMQFAQRTRLGSSYVLGIGGFRSARLGEFDSRRKAYKVIPVEGVHEVLSLVGDVALADGSPVLHVHATLATSDGTAIGGHLLEAYVAPTFEMFVTECPGPLERKHDAETDLDLIVPRGP